MDKQAQLSMFSGAPTLSDLEQKIQQDMALNVFERQQVLGQLRQDIGFASPSTPLSQLAPRIGGGILGFLVSKYFSMGPVGQVVSTMAGYGIGKVVGGFYNTMSNFEGGPSNSMRPFG